MGALRQGPGQVVEEEEEEEQEEGRRGRGRQVDSLPSEPPGKPTIQEINYTLIEK